MDDVQRASSVVTQLLPGLAPLRGYRRAWFSRDVVAGVTVAAYLIPQVMAYAVVAGVPPVVGLWAVPGPIIVYFFLGSSRQLAVGPESTTALMTAVVVGPMAHGDPARYAVLASLLAVIAGGVCLIARVVRLGLLADLLSKPVLIGYMTGISVMMISGQLSRITRVPAGDGDFVGEIRSFVDHVGETHAPTLVLSVGVLAALALIAKTLPKVPGPLVVILAATLIVSGFDLGARGIRQVGALPVAFPAPSIPVFTFADLTALVLPAAGIAMVAYADYVLTARAFAAASGREIDANAELAALGVSNIVVGLMHGFPVSCSGSRTAIGALMGSRTQVFSLFTLVSVLVAVFALGDVLAEFPVAALGALVIYAAVRLIDVGEIRRVARFRRSELGLVAVTTLAVVFLGVLTGVLVAVALSILDLFRRVARAHDAVLGFVPDVAGMHDLDDYPDARPVPGLVIYRYDAPLCFANADDFRRSALAAVAASPTPVRWFILNAEANVEVDLTALDALERLRADLQMRGIVVALARVKQDLRNSLDAAGLTDKIGAGRIFLTLPTAVDAFRHQTAGINGSTAQDVSWLLP